MIPQPRGRPVKYDRDFLLSIPQRLENGSTLEQIAAEVNTKPRLLMQTCRRAGVFSDMTEPTKLRLAIDVEIKLRRRAEAMGITSSDLSSRLIEVIAREDLFSAVLD